MAVYDGKGWRLLPPNNAKRIGWEGALAADGRERDATFLTLASLVVAVAFAAAAFWLRLSFQVSLLSLLLGGGAGAVFGGLGLLAIWLVIGARF